MIGKRGKAYTKARRSAIEAYCKRWGHKENDILHGPCQSCGRFMAATFLDFSHKIPAGRDSKGNTPENGTAMCRKCHSWLETSRDQTLAREALIESPSNLINGWMIQWPLGLNISLSKWMAR